MLEMKDRGLGKGLDALIPRAVQVDSGGVEASLRTDEIRPNPHQPRSLIPEEGLNELAQSIRTHGMLQPVIVRRTPTGYELAAGERRWRAAQIAGLAVIPAIVRDYTDEEMLLVALIENLQREDINPIDAGRAYQRLTDQFGLTHDDIARVVGKSRVAVSNTLRLLRLPEEVQEGIRLGHLTEGHGRALLGLGRAEDILELATLIDRDRLSVRDAEKLARRAERARRRSRLAAQRLGDPNLQELEEGLQRALGTRVEIRHRPTGRGTIVISYFYEEELTRLAEMLCSLGRETVLRRASGDD